MTLPDEALKREWCRAFLTQTTEGATGLVARALGPDEDVTATVAVGLTRSQAAQGAIRRGEHDSAADIARCNVDELKRMRPDPD